MTADGPEIIGGASLYLGDCLQILPVLRGINHVIADPPYEDELHTAARAGRIMRTDGQAAPRGPDFAGIGATRAEASGAIAGACRGWAVVFTLAEGVRAWRDALQEAGARYDTALCWVKPDAMPRFNGQGAARGFECMTTAWCGKGRRRWNGGGKRGLYIHNTAKGGHPTAKPVPLMMELVADYTDPSDLVCDPFAGSGATGVACLRLGRRFIGIESNPVYYRMARERIAAAAAEPSLPFSPVPEQARLPLGAA